MVGRVALGNRPNDGEGVENIDNVQHRTYRQGRTDQRHGNLEKLLPVISSVYRCSLIISGINTLQTGEDAERNKRNGYKDTTGNLPHKICLRSRSPVDRMVYQTKPEQQSVQCTIVSVNDEFPRACLDNQCCGPRENHNGSGNLTSAEFVVQYQGKYEAQYRGQNHNSNGPDDGVAKNQLERGTVHYFGEVGKTGKSSDDTSLADFA